MSLRDVTPSLVSAFLICPLIDQVANSVLRSPRRSRRKHLGWTAASLRSEMTDNSRRWFVRFEPFFFVRSESKSVKSLLLSGKAQD